MKLPGGGGYPISGEKYEHLHFMFVMYYAFFFLEIMAVVKCVFVQLAEESQKEFIHSVKASVEISMISAPLVRRGLF
jgi:uncharacterized membrane protein YcgQ (UPF0703/DUF1980 family)